MNVRIEHIALWTTDLERSRAFYQTYFGASPNKKYTNTRTGLQTYFLTFDSGPRLELMTLPDLSPASPDQSLVGWAHIALSVGDETAVDDLTARLQADGYTIVNGPRRTGDGYYESVVLDPDGNHIELTAG